MYIVHFATIDFVAPLNIQRAMALWFLKSREIHKIPLSVMDDIAKDIQSQ